MNNYNVDGILLLSVFVQMVSKDLY